MLYPLSGSEGTQGPRLHGKGEVVQLRGPEVRAAGNEVDSWLYRQGARSQELVSL